MGVRYFKDQINSLVEDLVTEAKNWDMSKLGPHLKMTHKCAIEISKVGPAGRFIMLAFENQDSAV